MDSKEISSSGKQNADSAFLNQGNSALWRHFRRHLLIGLALCSVLTFIIILYKFYSTNSSYQLTNTTRLNTDAGRSANDYAWLGILFLITSGAGAALGGLLRHPFLVWLSRRARTRAQFIWGSVVGFELTVLVAALLYWWLTDTVHSGQSGRALGFILMACFLISLPWLLSTGWASWRLAAELRIPPHENASLSSV